jgi:hypothetical protein
MKLCIVRDGAHFGIQTRDVFFRVRRRGGYNRLAGGLWPFDGGLGVFYCGFAG